MLSLFENVDWARLQALGMKALHLALIGASALLGLSILAAVVLFIALQITPVRTALGDRVLAMLADGDGITIELGGYGGIWPVRLRVETLTVRDNGTLIAQAENLDVSWSPFALLRGIVHVDDLAAERVVVSALPQGDDAPDAPPGPLIPSLPVDVQVDALDLPDIRVAAGIAGDVPVVLAAQGHATLAGASLLTDLSIRRTDGGVFDLAIKTDINPDADMFNVDVSLKDGTAGAPGLIAALTGNSDLGVVVFTARASGPADDWAARVDADGGRIGKLDFSLTGDRREGGALLLDTTFAPGAVLDGVPEPLRVTASIARRNATYSASDVSAFVGEAGFAGQVNVADPADGPRVQLDGNVINLSSIVGTPVPEIIGIRADATVDTSFTQIEVAAIDVQADGLAASFAGAIDTASRVAKGLLELDARDIRPLAAMAGVDAAGPLVVRADLDALTFDGDLEGDVTAEFKPVSLPVAGLADVFGDALTLEGRFASLAALPGTRIEALSLAPSSGVFAVRASGDVSVDAVDVQLAVTAESVAPFSSLAGTQLLGGASLQSVLTGRVDRLSANSTLTLSEAQIAGVPVEGVASANLLVGSGVEGPIAFTGRLGDTDADVTAQLVSQAGGTSMNDIVARLLDMVVTGNAALQSGGAMTAELAGDVTSLRAAGRVLGTALDGSGTFKMTSTPGDTGNDLKADASLRRVVVEGVQVGRIGLSASVAPSGAIASRARLGRVSAGNLSAAAGTVAASGPVDRLSLSAELTGISTFEDQNGTGMLDLAALYEGAASRVTLSRLEGVLAGVPVKLGTPATFSLKNGVRVEALMLDLGQGRVQLDAAQRSSTLEVETRINDAPLALLIALAGQTSEVRGTLSGDMVFKTRGATGSGEATLKVAPVGLGSAAGTGTVLPVFLLDADWDGRSASTRVTADMPGAEDLVATASLPVAARNGRPYLASRAALDARLKGTLDLGAVWPLLPVDSHVMTGLVDMDLTARGPFADMDIAGSARMRDGSYEGLETGVILTPLEVSLVTQDGQADILVETRDGGAGTLKGQGRFDLRDGAGDRLKVALDMASFRVLGRDDLSALASGDIHIVWPRGEGGTAMPLTVGGDMTIERLEARIPDQLASDVETIEVTRVSADGVPVDPQDDGAAQDEAGSEPASIELAFRVDAPRAAFVRGRGLESEWAGKMDIAGSVTAPVLQGAFQVQRGTFDFLGQSFDLTGGRIEFTGGEEIDPYLDVKAVYEDDDFQAIVTVTGPSSAPTLDVSSIPVLPQDEILARILFGTGTGQLTAFQAVQLADAAATLAGASTGGGVLDTMRRALGVDVLSLGEGGLEVGSYVRDGVYVGVSQGLDAGTGEVSVEVELTDEFSLESDVGTAGDTSVGVTWGRDY